MYGREPWSAFPTHFVQRGPQYNEKDVDRWLGHNAFVVFGTRGKTLPEMKKELKKNVLPHKPHYIFLTHVERETGNEIPLPELCEFIQHESYQTEVIVDGVMALGNIDVDLDELMSHHKHFPFPPQRMIAFAPEISMGRSGQSRN